LICSVHSETLLNGESNASHFVHSERVFKHGSDTVISDTDNLIDHVDISMLKLEINESSERMNVIINEENSAIITENDENEQQVRVVECCPYIDEICCQYLSQT
jgi:hypothetical protein